ncbi:TrkH family potassium uptake protein [uncultured Algimonas sp.]|uniref:TrkH family potassium uptake protein n=1 Tax=uncultured Algimonas sp. TaxID=1547920 RepID=UPI00260CCEB4|nr:TrkH family potassium uptake protein [uncultured Algimonas sp.]
MADLRSVFFVIGLMALAMGLLMFVPMAVDLLYEDRSWQAFAISGLVVTLIGGALATATYNPVPDIRARGAFVLTVFSWIVLAVLAALPFMLDPVRLSLTDAFFEATSGITTTGSTVMTGIDDMPKGILLWRAMLQWIGGIGIIVTAMAILPMLGVGGMQLFRLESSDVGEKILPRARSIALTIAGIYLGLTLSCATAYTWTGMSVFDAVAHAMTTIATGGYSTSDASMGGFMDDGADIVGMVFMLLGALPFGVYMLMVRRGQLDAPARDPQVRAFLSVVVMLSLLVCVALVTSGAQDSELGLLHSLRLSAFNTISIITGTGYATADYMNWGAMAVGAFFFYMFIGGCAGSTACSIKIFRYQVALEALRAYLFRMPRPHAIAPMRYNGRPLPDAVVYSVLGYFFLFFVTVAVIASILGAIGLDPVTAWSGAGSAVANVGPGLGDIIGPSGTYQDLPKLAKWALMTGMVVGRLEIVTALVVLTPGFWRA